MITLTPSAARQILAAPRPGGTEELALRVAARLAPDGSVQYALGFDEQREGDLAIEEQGIQVLIGAPSQALLRGVTLDFVEYEPGDFRFIFVPAETPSSPAGGGCGSGCSCGASR
jgi:iron-sulfur cluster assembly protein